MAIFWVQKSVRIIIGIQPDLQKGYRRFEDAASSVAQKCPKLWAHVNPGFIWIYQPVTTCSDKTCAGPVKQCFIKKKN